MTLRECRSHAHFTANVRRHTVAMSSVLLITAIALALVYMGLAVSTFPYLKPERKKEQREWLLAISFWWPFYADMYDGSIRERKLRLWGKAIFVLTLGAYLWHWSLGA